MRRLRRRWSARPGKVREAENQRRYNAYAKYRGEDESAEKEPDKTEQTPIQRAMTYIRRTSTKDLSRAEIADAIYLNPEYLSCLFKKWKTGASLNDYIVTEKMRAAQSLLSDTNIPVSLIATNVGYSNFSYFSQVFKKYTACRRWNTVRQSDGSKL